uniref:Ubiquitin carboxyl-terminal hydrolase n=1 Tax=Glossina austeni TaxID=7395 RepID=A0A1A9UE04_GLOAU
MPVTSPRRSLILASGSIYGTSSSTTGGSSVTSASLSSSTTSERTSGYKSYLDRAGSLSKYSVSTSTSSSYSPSYSSYLSGSSYSSYSPRSYSTYRSTGSSLTGGSSGIGTYRSTSSSLNNYDTNSCGVNKRSKDSDTLRKDSIGQDVGAKKPPSGSEGSGSQSKRTPGSCSSSSLARLVATSALDIYEKYSPAHYKPNTELSGSRSSGLSEAAATDSDDRRSTTSDVAYERPRSRYSRLYSQQKNVDEVDNIGAAHNRSGSGSRISGRLNIANLAEDVPTATVTLHGTRLRKAKGHEEDKKFWKNGAIQDHENNSNGLDVVIPYGKLNKLKLNSNQGETPEINQTQGNNKLTDSGGSMYDISENVDIKWNNADSTKEDVNDNAKIRNSVHTTASPVSRYWERDSSRPSISTTRSHADERKLSFSSEDTEGLCGLRNIGNTCFMNSVIQCLSHTNELTKFLRNYSATKSPISKDQQILYEFSKLIREMWSPNTHSVTPLELKRAFSSKHRMYSDYNQQDAQEFLRFFLDSLHSALNTGNKGEHLRVDDNLSDNRKAEQTWEWYCRHECSIIRDLFVGQLKSTLRCTVCGNASVTFDPFWDLSVPLPSSSRCKLEACLDLFIREEVLDGDEMPTCSKCQTRRKCTKTFTIQRFPKYLVIHLKRFSETRWSKLSNIVEFPTGERELNMAPYAANTNSNMYYSLYAISNHMGSTAGGHYVAICKHPFTQKWHEFNDNLVSDALSEHHLVSSSAYILFYERA